MTASIEIPSKLDPLMERAKDDQTLTVTMTDGDEIWYGELKNSRMRTATNTPPTKYRSTIAMMRSPSGMSIASASTAARPRPPS